MSDAQATSSKDRGAPRPAWGPWVLAAGLVLCFAEYLAWMLERWWRDEYYGHGFLIPIISGWLIYHHRARLRALPRERFGAGLPVMAAGLLIHIAATWLSVNFPSGFALIITLHGAVIWIWGWPVARAVAFPIAYLAFMVPLARLLVDQFAQPLQLFSAQFGGALAHAIGVPTEVDGTTIQIPGYTFEVAIVCSGLKSSIAMSALAALYAYMLDAAMWKRALIVVASVPVAIFANAGRIFITLVLGRVFGSEAAEGFFHSMSGVVVFMFALIGLFLVGAMLRCTKMRADI